MAVCGGEVELFRETIVKGQQSLNQSTSDFNKQDSKQTGCGNVKAVSVAGPALVLVAAADSAQQASKPESSNLCKALGKDSAKKANGLGEYRDPLCKVKSVGGVEHNKNAGNRTVGCQTDSQAQAVTEEREQRAGVAEPKPELNTMPVEGAQTATIGPQTEAAAVVTTNATVESTVSAVATTALVSTVCEDCVGDASYYVSCFQHAAKAVFVLAHLVTNTLAEFYHLILNRGTEIE